MRRQVVTALRAPAVNFAGNFVARRISFCGVLTGKAEGCNTGASVWNEVIGFPAAAVKPWLTWHKNTVYLVALHLFRTLCSRQSACLLWVISASNAVE